MAVSAFRSTTRRCGETPGSKRYPSPSPFTRRSGDIAYAKYLSDCSSSTVAEYRTRSKGSRSRELRSVYPSDSESDADFLHVHGQPCTESEDENRKCCTVSGSNTLHGHADPKGSLNAHSLVGPKQSLIHHPAASYEEAKGIGSVVGVGEKTIRHIHDLESLRSDPPIGDFGTSDFVDAMRLEVQRAVAEIRMELAESMRINGDACGNDQSQNFQDAWSADMMDTLRDVRKEFSTKLEQSEKKVLELWSQLAIEERQCMELAKIVKELLPSTESPRMQRIPSSNRRRSYRRRSSEERLIAMSLDDEAQKYIEDCVAISVLNGGNCGDILNGGNCDDTFDSPINELNTFSVAPDTTVKELKQAVSTPQHDNQVNYFPVENDGVFLPWLQWESEVAASDRNAKAMKRQLSHKSSGNNRGNNGSDNPYYASPGKLSMDKKFCSGKLFSSSLVSKATGVPKLAKPLDFTADETTVHRNKILPRDIETFLLGKINFKSRVESGELVMCEGLFI